MPNPYLHTFRLNLALLSIATISCLLCIGSARAADGPGLGNLTYTSGELFDDISRIDSPESQGKVAMVNGYLFVPYSSDSGGNASNGGIEFWNVSNPRSPTLQARHDNADTHGLREAHGFGFSTSYPWDVGVMQGIDGIQFWDLTNPDSIALLDYMDLPGITQGDYSGDWWVFFQAPYVFVAGVGQGLYVVDASDPVNPVLVTQVPTGQLAGRSPGVVFAVGNLLVAMGNGANGYTTVDISDPTNPTLITSIAGVAGYSHLFAADGKILTSGGNGGPETMVIHQVSNDGSSISFVGQGTTSSCPGLFQPALDNGGYGSYQDGFFISGFSNRVAKFRVSDLARIDCGTAGIFDSDEDFGIVLGNLIWAGNDHDGGSGLLPHQQGQDLTGPSVDWVHPPNGATDQALTSRVGVMMSDLIEMDSVDATTFIVRPQGGAALPGKYSVQMGIVNFSPDAPLAPGTTYEVVVSGMQDYVGNAGGSFQSTFTTSGQQTPPPTCDLGELAPVETGALANLDVVSTTGPPDTYSWTFGDMTPATPPSATSGTTHSWLAPGRYSVQLTVENTAGSSSCSAVQIVHNALTTSAPVSSSPIAYDGARVYNVNPDNDSVSAISGSSLNKVWEQPVGDNPRTLAVAPDGRIWVVGQDDATITILNAANGSFFDSFSLPRGSAPYGIAFAPDGSAAFVTLEATGELVKLSTAGAILGTVPVGPKPRGIAISGDSSRVLVTRFISEAARLTDPADPGSIVLPTGEVREVDPSTMTLVRTIPLAFDPGPDTEASGRGVPNYITALRISPDGTRVLVPSKKDNVARGDYLDGVPLTFESRTRTIVSEIDLAGNVENLAARLDVNDRDMAQSLIFSPLGDIYFIGLQGSNEISVHDANTNTRLGAIDTGQAPQGLALDAVGERLFVHEFMSRAVSVFDVSSFLDASGSSATSLGQISTVNAESLAPDVLLGKTIFYDASDPRMSKDGYISCASCHLDGGSDGQVWDFTQVGEGLRNTVEMRGRAGIGHGNVHWTANFDEIQDFENDIRGGFGGTGFLTAQQFIDTSDPLGLPKTGLSAELDALAAYAASLTDFPDSPYRNPDGSLTDDGRRGRRVFHERGCVSCHSGDAFADGLRHDVGTIQASSGQGIGLPLAGVGIETQTLKGIWSKPPYLHNGQAQTLEEVLDSSLHGATDVLGASERNRLASYLRQLEGSDRPPVDEIDLSGLAQGGTFGVTIDGVSVQVTTIPGETAEQVLVALEMALNAEPGLPDMDASTIDGNLLVSAPITLVSDGDPGLSVNGGPAPVPLLTPLGLLFLPVLLAGAGTCAASCRRRR